MPAQAVSPVISVMPKFLNSVFDSTSKFSKNILANSKAKSALIIIVRSSPPNTIGRIGYLYFVSKHRSQCQSVAPVPYDRLRRKHA